MKQKRASIGSLQAKVIRSVIASYEDPVVAWYSWGRFWILRQRFLEEIGQYLPAQGTILDIGCGFGLFSLYFASNLPECEFVGFDLNPRRVKMARAAAQELGLSNVRYEVGNATTFAFREQLDGAYMLDIIHHIPKEEVKPLLRRLYEVLRVGSTLVVKDVDDGPRYKRWFTWALDKAMDPTAQVHYWSSAELMELMESIGFQVFRHSMTDFLPYPHMLYVCHKHDESR